MSDDELVEALSLAEDPLLRILGEVMTLQRKKSADYNAKVDRNLYWVFGQKSIIQMLWTKVLRLVSLAKSEAGPNYESIEDTAKDLIVYSLFLIEWNRNASR